MKRLDQAIQKLAELHGATKLSSDEIKALRQTVEAKYLDNLLDGVDPFVDKKAKVGQ